MKIATDKKIGKNIQIKVSSTNELSEVSPRHYSVIRGVIRVMNSHSNAGLYMIIHNYQSYWRILLYINDKGYVYMYTYIDD